MSGRSPLLHAVHRLDVLAPDFDATGPDVAASQFAYWRADTDLGPAVLRYEDVAADLRVDGPVEWRPPIGIVGPRALTLRFRRR